MKESVDLGLRLLHLLLQVFLEPAAGGDLLLHLALELGEIAGKLIVQ